MKAQALEAELQQQRMKMELEVRAKQSEIEMRAQQAELAAQAQVEQLRRQQVEMQASQAAQDGPSQQRLEQEKREMEVALQKQRMEMELQQQRMQMEAEARVKQQEMEMRAKAAEQAAQAQAEQLQRQQAEIQARQAAVELQAEQAARQAHQTPEPSPQQPPSAMATSPPLPVQQPAVSPPAAPPPPAPAAPSPSAPAVPGASCSGLTSLAEQFGVSAPSGSTWLAMFSAVAEQLPHAVAITDMKTPGLPVTFANSAMVALTGYPKDEIEGRNCRFLQGKKTEAAAVRAMVSAIRRSKPQTVKVTNYRKDGSSFQNVLSLLPVVDSSGEYRFNVGVLADGARLGSEGDALEKLRAAVPRSFDAALQPQRFDASLKQVDEDAQRKQWRQSMVKFTRLLWSADWEGSMRQIVMNQDALQTFGQWLAEKAPSDAMQLELIVNTMQLGAMPPEQAGPMAMQMCQQLFGQEAGSPEEAMSGLANMAEQALRSLAAESFPKFVQSKACLPLVEQLLGGAADEVRLADGLIWPQYEVAPDVAGWVHSFASVACALPACIVISDMAMPGNPMLFVNDEFCRVTGYERHEAQGRNCRFLQGPRTEPQSVAVIQDTLRRGVDCHVKITNYRKSGELFENLLTMRPVHDSNGVYRFCIGVQFEVTRDTNLKARLAKLDKLIKLLPSTLEVSSAASGDAHGVEATGEETATELATKLQSALEGAAEAPGGQVLQGSDYFADNHETMLQEIGVAGGAAAT